MKKTVAQLIDELPEIYQNIYGYPEYDSGSSRNCILRKKKIVQVVETYMKKSGKKELRILDIGCAQGFYSFSLAELGCTVDAVDYLSENIQLCCALQKENKLACHFQQDIVSKDWAEALSGKYDVILFLSVIHHIANENGFIYARELLELLSQKTDILITELALKEEPLYWNRNLPTSYTEWFGNIPFYCKVGDFETHLSEFRRPMLVSSSEYVFFHDHFYEINQFKKNAYAGKTDTEGKRYYYCENKHLLIKVFQGVCPESAEEIKREIAFLKDNQNLSFVPELIDYEIDKDRIVEVQKIHFGALLSDMISNRENLSFDRVFIDILDNCVELEKCGLYHKDIHPWNICVDQETGKAFLIDFGNTETGKRDTITNIQFRRPDGEIHVFETFVAMVYDCLINNVYPSIETYGGYQVSLYRDLSRIPVRYRNFIKQYMLISEDKLSFDVLRALFQNAVIDSCEYTYSVEDKQILLEKQLAGLDYQKAPYIELLVADSEYRKKLDKDRMEILGLKDQINTLQGQITGLQDQCKDLDRLIRDTNIRIQEIASDLQANERRIQGTVNEMQAEINSVRQWIVLRGYRKVKGFLARKKRNKTGDSNSADA